MSLTRHMTPDHTIKVEEDTRSLTKGNTTISDVNPPRKCARPRSITGLMAADTEAHTTSSEHVKEEELLSLPDMLKCGSSQTHTDADYERLQQLLEAAFRTWEAVMKHNIALAAELRTTCCELHKLHAFMEFASNKLFQQATHQFCGIDSDTASEDKLEDSKSEEEDM
ncbi:hypothetical protein B0H14DRAFT_3469523 [Mycena olivaceomarginata]|nr:hypothetical protein B0H14DRAFT_3469523 [Mycena olivaceomarginata]